MLQPLRAMFLLCGCALLVALPQAGCDSGDSSHSDAGNEPARDAATDGGDEPERDAGTDSGVSSPSDAGDAGNQPQTDAGTDAGSPACTPGELVACYTGPAATKGVGACTGGEKKCRADGSGFDACEGQVVPAAASCASGDVDCNGQDDGAQDLDGDGYTVCDNDCCDDAADGCGQPELVNPGAFDVAGNGDDDDCSGTADDGTASCDAALASNSGDALDYARALDLCRTTVTSPAQMSDSRWGVISASFALSDGTGSPNAVQRSIRAAFGQILPQHGDRLTVLATGAAAGTSDTSPAPVAFDPGYNAATTSPMPTDWLAANGNAVPQAPACPAVAVANVFDPVMLKLSVRAPTNARSFSFRGYFLSAEYPEWVCSAYNDFFVALLDSAYAGAPANPSDKNLAVYVTPSSGTYPIGVGLAYGNTGLFRQCVNGSTGCSSNIAGTVNSCVGTADLVGTGFETANANKCDSSSINGGGTGWLRFSGNVVPGEIFTLRLIVWDTGDATIDSLVVLDDFEWSEDAVTPGAVP